ncbi:MAG: ABC-F family ATP-binding cassette domain-containing protein [Lachnospiraceae bacterium]|nr:ABC-F family ATP-binding cassette domain-containing protein [Lachnospiraceae bacterium]MDD3615895.1 ABC-F family ATP-binding cassette domain-containing protein [Lachnospiraceae bacterium]
MILSCQHIKKTFSDQTLFSEVSFHIEEREKAALVGANGTGKSTLLKIIMGEQTCDSGEIILSKGKTIGYLAQHQELNGSQTIYDTLLEVKQDIITMEQNLRQLELDMKHNTGEKLEELMEQYTRLSHRFELENGYAFKSEINGVLKGLGFDESEYAKEVATLSGGQKTRVTLGKLLLQNPDILLLDEPTNHLDLNSINWLETYLLNYSGAVLIVSHDRYFLDRIVTKVIGIENGTCISFSGNYTAFHEKLSMIREAQYKAYVNQQKEIQHQEEVIARLKSFNREKSIKRAESREKALEKVEVLEKPQELDVQMRLHLTPRILSGNDVLTIEDLSKSFDKEQLFQNVNIEIKRGEHVAVIGNNGSGKTTLLKIINELVPADTGTVRLGSKVQIGYYDQEHHVLHKEKTIFQEISDDYPTLTNTEIRNVLAAFLFTGEDVFKPIQALSGGERGRVSLAKLMLSEANFLILDEPTNHLDIYSKEILENALNHYSGTLLYVSHDRYFINQTATRILDLEGGNFVNYIGNYDYYLEKHLQNPTVSSNEEGAKEENISETKLDWKIQKEEQARIRKRQNDLKKTESQIEQLEAKDQEIDEELTKEEVFTDVAKCMALNKEKLDIANQLETLYELWETLAE